MNWPHLLEKRNGSDGERKNSVREPRASMFPEGTPSTGRMERE
jgi:hypothetical protein